MRILLVITSVAIAALGVAAGAPGAYEIRETRDAASCARACEDDGLCQSWAFSAGKACELMAVVPISAAADGVASGLSSRAPTFGRGRTSVAPAATAEQATPAVSVVADAARDMDIALLGGPEPETLRERLRN